MMNKRLIVELRQRTLAEYSVLMTLCGFSVAVGAMFLATGLDRHLTGAALFSAAACFWLSIMAYLWLHFFHAARRFHLTPSSTRLFHTIQYVALTFAAVPMVLFRGSSSSVFLFSAVSLGVEAALGAFFMCYVFLAGTLCQHVPRSAFLGLGFSLIGFYSAYQKIISL